MASLRWFQIEECLVFVALFLLNDCLAFHCAQQASSNCKCTFDDPTRTVVDLAAIGNSNGSPKFPFGQYGYTSDFSYAFNPCFAFSDGNCKDVVACQRFKDVESQTFDIGDPTPVSWNTVSNNDIEVSYSSTQEGTQRTTIVTYSCDQTALQPVLTISGEAPTNTYNFEVKTCAVCAPAVTGCQAAPGGISVGGILCIVFTLLVAVYIVVGALYQTFARGAKGLEVLPNYSFWVDFPALVKDGFLFMISPCTGQRGSYENM